MAHEGIILENLDMVVIGNGRNLFGTKDYGTPELQYPTPQLGKFKQLEDLMNNQKGSATMKNETDSI